MYTTEDLINDLENFNHYVDSLKIMKETLFFEPIADGKRDGECLKMALVVKAANNKRNRKLKFPALLPIFLFPQHLKKIFKQDRKSTRLNSSHVAISYAVFCLKKKHLLE